MISLLILGILALVLWCGFMITGTIFVAFFWLFIKVPIAFMLFILGLVLCCTIILIPLGLILMKVAISLFIPGRII